VRESDFGSVTLLHDFKDDIRVPPLALVFGEIETVVQDLPDKLLAGNQLCDFQSTEMGLPIAIHKLGAELTDPASDILRPPPANIRDGVKGCLRSFGLPRSWC
jgi:hypothetical protein